MSKIKSAIAPVRWPGLKKRSMPDANSDRALVISDSHGNLKLIDKALDRFREVDYVFHLGDCAGDAAYIVKNSKAKVFSVRGNCDFASNDPYFKEVTIRGQKIILTHGHKLKVKYSLDRLFYYAQEHEAKTILFGHTHVAYCEFQDGIWMVNPGSVSEPRGNKPSVARLLIGRFGVVPKIVFLD